MKTSSKDYMLLLLERVYTTYCKTGLTGFPNTNLPQHQGKEVTQYYFATLSSPLFTEIHSLWYR